MRSVAICICCIALAACGMTVSQRAYVMCSGFASALSSLAVHKREGRLNDGMIAAVDKTRAVVNPLCRSAVTSHDDLDAIERGVKQLLDIKERADG